MPTIGLCIIVKNGAATIAACLKSASGLIAQTVVVDTGSQDNTIAIARSCGATVVEFPWKNDFAAARNAALALITTDWVLVLDADEELDPAAHKWIRRELRSPHADGYVVPIRNYQRPGTEPLINSASVPPDQRHPRAPLATRYVTSQVCRLFRRDPEIYYLGHVHEQVEYRLMQLERAIAIAGFFIHHFGWYLIDDDRLKRKHEMYRELLAQKVVERPNDPVVLMQYGDALCEMDGETSRGLDCFLKAAALKPDDATIWAHIAPALLKLGQYDAALIAIEQIPRNDDFSGVRAELRGQCLALLKRWEEARVAFREALAYFPDYVGIKAKLALLEIECGDHEAGMAWMRLAVKTLEDDAESTSTAHAHLRGAQLLAQVKDWPEALRLLDAGLCREPASLPLLELRVLVFVAMDRLREAADTSADIVRIGPSSKAILRHISILNEGQYLEEASDALDLGIVLYPDDVSLLRARTALDQMLIST